MKKAFIGLMVVVLLLTFQGNGCAAEKVKTKTPKIIMFEEVGDVYNSMDGKLSGIISSLIKRANEYMEKKKDNEFISHTFDCVYWHGAGSVNCTLTLMYR